MAAAVPGAELSTMPAPVTLAVSAPKTTVSAAKAAMNARNTSLSATAAISSKRGRRHQQCAGNGGSKRELAYH
jgi:hypothetical protein